MKLKIDKKDILIMTVLFVLYAIVAIINLGDKKVPETEYTPEKVGESFILQFPRKHAINRINYYSGLGFTREVELDMSIKYRDANNNFVPLTSGGESCKIEKKFGECFILNSIDFDVVGTDALKFEVTKVGGTINEISVYKVRSKTPIEGIKLVDATNENAKYLIDESDVMQCYRTHKNSTYFDEIYHARTAYEHIHNIKQYENTHPPLGKLFIALGIKLFGMTPFGWRIVGTLFGAFMVPVMYLFGLKVFETKFLATMCSLLMMFDCMHFTQTRIATIDVYVTFFIILMYYWMYDVYMLKDNYYKSFALSGLMFGIGVASKWIALYASVGLFILFLLSKYKLYKKGKDLEIMKTLVYGSVFFVIIPIIIYVVSYIPVMGGEDGYMGLIDTVIGYAKHMYTYHSDTVLTATHPFQSRWYEWQIIKRPIWYYVAMGLPGGKRSTIVCLGNPAIWWTSILALIYTIVVAIKEKDRRMVPILVAFFCQYAPWMLVKRVTFIYHFFSMLPFAIIMVVYMFRKRTKLIYPYMAVVMILFIVFYPAISGIPVTENYIDKLKWFKSWVF
ncbi:MAG: phospholipid carrier-dependent glycosyltransferase [Clostridiales bacterium]|nr:phospholipid carrier-dependent glycosyltransferase [Clostridiales bacterium]